MNKYIENAQWHRINNRIDEIDDLDMSTFKQNKSLFIFATWAPERFGIYYLKTLLSLMARNLSEADYKLLDKIKNRTFGAPLTTRVNGRDVCLDYMQAITEAKFIGDVGNQVQRIVEIGAGYGRTCHTLLSLYEHIDEYVIIDLHACLDLSKKYLSNVLSAEVFAKIRFVKNTECEEYFASTKAVPTLAVNCDSIGEMDKKVSRSYLSLIEQNADYFYSCNPVAKYLPSCFGEVDTDPDIVKDSLSAGLITEAINVFDDEVVQASIPTYLETLNPSKSWEVTRFKVAEMYTYYVHVLYTK
ncbi:MAG: hypothetical protein COB46_01355 [Rhodospirillaceae bacterium]|nr:MAG: hypothetical protein COB46_01355 [Rhodospirillaceae bacterium]